jgi:hypothetical protein
MLGRLTNDKSIDREHTSTSSQAAVLVQHCLGLGAALESGHAAFRFRPQGRTVQAVEPLRTDTVVHRACMQRTDTDACHLYRCHRPAIAFLMC